MQTAQDLYDELERVAPEILPAYVALVWYPAMGTMNVLKLQLLSGMEIIIWQKSVHSVPNDYAKEAKGMSGCRSKDHRAVSSDR